MAMSMDEFVKRTKAEVVGGNVIVGGVGNKVIAGRVEQGVFNLTADGQEILNGLEKNDPDAVNKRVPKKRASDLAGKTAADVAEE